jgi:hypothetical protein
MRRFLCLYLPQTLWVLASSKFSQTDNGWNLKYTGTLEKGNLLKGCGLQGATRTSSTVRTIRMAKMVLGMSLMLSIVTVARAQAQTAPKDQSNIEKFSAKSGTLIEKQFVDIGSLKQVKVQLLIITDMIVGSKVSGVRLEYVASSRYSSDTKVTFLDSDEVDGLIKSITILKSRVLNSTRDNYTEIVFRSRSGFEAGGYFSEGKWTTFVKLERFDKDSYVFMKPDDFDTLLGLLQQAKPRLL